MTSKTITEKRHPVWVRLSHWLVSIAFLLLIFSGIEILMVHPRLYWGETGNDLTPALFELPISRNYKHGGWEYKDSFAVNTNVVRSASRTYDIWNYNGWGRSLHFLSGWLLVLSGVGYFIISLFTGHLRRKIIPANATFKNFRDDVKLHRTKMQPATSYGLLQRTAYSAVILLLFPLVILTGITMAPAVTAALPFLLDIFNGFQSARTVHFFTAALLLIFLILHIVMVVRTGFSKQVRLMTIGGKSVAHEKE